MMKPRSWIKTMAASALMSPRASLRKANSSPRTPKAATTASSMPAIPLPMLTTLTRAVHFLDDHHHEEEGLYSKPGVHVECKELLAFCRRYQLPDLHAYSPHSIASVVKETLSELYKPLISARISEQLLEAVSSGRLDDEAERTITETFKQIRSTTRDFLRVFLCHLNHVASSGSSRMSVTNLALHVGIALIRPIEDRAVINSKAMVRRRKCVAEFLIHQAASLPYDCATELNIPAIPELAVAPTIATTDSASRSPKQLHFVQVTWDSGEARFTPEELEEMFRKFGDIESLGINDQGNRAIVAYSSGASAVEAESASIPSVRVRRRKPRQAEKRHEYSPEHTRSRSSATLQTAAADADTVERGQTTQDLSRPQGEYGIRKRIPVVEKQASSQVLQAPNLEDDTIVVEDIEDEPTYDDQQEYPRPTIDVQTELDILPTSEVVHNDSTANLAEPTQDEDPALGESQSVSANETARQTELARILSCDQCVSAEASTIEISKYEKSSEQVEDMKQPSYEEEVLIKSSTVPDSLVDTKSTNQTSEITIVSLPPKAELPSEVKQPNRSTAAQQATEKLAEGSQSESSGTKITTIPKIPVIVRTLQDTPCAIRTDTQRESPLIFTGCNQQDQAIDSDEIAHPTKLPVANPGDHPSAVNLTDTVAVEELRNRLVDMEKILSTSTAALSATKATEFERAILQLHKQVLDMVAGCLVLAGARPGEETSQSVASSTSNAEYLDFLEAQAKTQVKILEVEVRAGQELLRLHKKQFEKERVEFEEEITALRVGRTETERLCAELRVDLRKCRSELACHVANATDIQRQKSSIEEKLVTVENQLHATEVALTKLQKAYDQMHRVAAEAQARVERFKLGDYNAAKTRPDNQSGHSGLLHFSNIDKRPSRIGLEVSLPHTNKFMTKHGVGAMDANDRDENVLPKETQPSTPAVSVRSSNVAALEAMKQQMARDIQEQIASTKAALREMEICSSNGKSLEEEEEELRRLQQQLATRSSEMDEVMNESRSRLQELLSPSSIPTSIAAPEGYQDLDSNQEPTIFDSTALVNELIARAKRDDPTYNIKQQRAEDELCLGESSPKLSRSIGTDDNAQYPPARGAQSVLYKKWTAKRSRKIAQLASYRDKQSVLLAQQSMQNFQQTLADVRRQR